MNVSNDTWVTTSETPDSRIREKVDLAEAIVAFVGLVGNILAYNVAQFLPQTNSSVLMQYLAGWDAIMIAHLGCWSLTRAFRIRIIDTNVSLYIDQSVSSDP